MHIYLKQKKNVLAQIITNAYYHIFIGISFMNVTKFIEIECGKLKVKF